MEASCGSDDSREIVVQASIFVDAGESGDDLEEEIPAVMFSCQYCEKYFKTMEAYEIHSQMHVDRNLMKCEYCENWYHTEDQLEIHLRDHLDMKPFFCRVCGDRFTNEHSLEHHLQLHGGIKLFRCIFCFEMFSVLELLNTHLVLHAPPNVYKFQEGAGQAVNTVKVSEAPRECQKIPPVLPVVVEEQRPVSPDGTTKRLMAKLPKLAPKSSSRKSSKASGITRAAKSPPKSTISPTKDPPEAPRMDKSSPTTSARDLRMARKLSDAPPGCQCKNCGVSFASGRKLRVHMRQRRRNKSVCRAKR
ncbi:zinc finger protein 26-like [Phlebotomus argentipes]|uniref:zinc finger protein 26-like n=1 Tax=Phlebotomus argentipes TaxID=94469 RepID=UPI0028937C86|nr:zinc finger protein 26-like [Phlebotomus argentipes]